MDSFAKPTPPGQLNQLISFWQETEIKDENGDVTVSLVEIFQQWAKVTPVRASEEEKYGELRDVRVNLFTFPRHRSISSELRIKWNGLEHNIFEVRDPGTNGADMIIKGISGVAQ